MRVISTGVALAFVVLVVGIVSNLVQAPTPRPSTGVTIAPGAADYQAGLDALASGDATKAAELLGKAAAVGNTAAKSKLAEIAKPTSPKPSIVASSAFEEAVPDVSVFLPGAVTGYELAEVETSPLSAIVAGEPLTTGPRNVSRVVLSVYDRKSAPGAKSWLADFDVAYAKNIAKVKVGSQEALFGTDGAHLASVAFVRGRYGFEVVATAVNVDPKDLKSLAIQAAESFSASR